jgi:hypothetical protein
MSATLTQGRRKNPKARPPAANEHTSEVTLRDADVDAYCDRWKAYRSKPQRMMVLRKLIMQAWDLVCYMADAGLKFESSSPEQAALTIAGSAFAAWRCDQPDNPDLDHLEAPANIIEGFAEGIMWAMWMGDGMPSVLADSYVWHADRSESVLDRMIPLEVIARLFPDMVKDGKLNLPRVRVQPVNPDAWDACEWDHRPNILTASVEEVKSAARRANLRDLARLRKKAAAGKRSKAKPRAK